MSCLARDPVMVALVIIFRDGVGQQRDGATQKAGDEMPNGFFPRYMFTRRRLQVHCLIFIKLQKLAKLMTSPVKLMSSYEH